jgi:hypothetical protein
MFFFPKNLTDEIRDESRKSLNPKGDTEKNLMLTLVLINNYRYGTSTSEFDNFAGFPHGEADQFFKHPICHDSYQ